MKYAFSGFAAFLALCATACQQATVMPADAQGITGEWHWVSTMGGITGNQTYTPASTGATETWVFKADSTYQHVTTQRGGTSGVDAGTFSLGSVISIHTNQPARALLLRGKQPQAFLIEGLTTRLALSDNHYDGFGYTYER